MEAKKYTLADLARVRATQEEVASNHKASCDRCIAITGVQSVLRDDLSPNAMRKLDELWRDEDALGKRLHSQLQELFVLHQEIIDVVFPSTILLKADAPTPEPSQPTA